MIASKKKRIDIEQQIPKEIYSNAISSLKGKKLFLTGGTGFFGKSLLEVLGALNEIEKLNLNLCILSRNPDAFKKAFPNLCHPDMVRLVKGDIENFEFPNERFDEILHFATTANSQLIQSNSEETFKTITEGSKRILDFCIKSKAKKFLLASSGAVYGKQPTDLSHIPEDYVGTLDPSSSFNVYAEGKRFAEELGNSLSRKYGFEHKIARCFAFVGPHLDPNGAYAIGNFIRDAITKNEIIISGDGTPLRSYLYSDDLIFWLIRILSEGKNLEAYNVGSDKALSILELAEKIREKTNPNLEIKVKGNGKDSRSVPYVPSIEKARRLLGLNTWITLDRAIDETIIYYKSMLK